MKANKGKYEHVALQCLEQLGGAVTPIPRHATEKMPDLLAEVGSSKVIVEIKDKFDDIELEVQRGRALTETGFHQETRTLGHNTTIARVIKEASKQLGRFARGDECFRVFWFNATGRALEAKRRQFKATVLGSQQILGLNLPDIRTCYFFNESSFFTHRGVLDGAVLAGIEGFQVRTQLVINPLSPKYTDFLVSDFARIFGDGILDPIREEARGALILGEDADRSTEDAKLGYLSSKYCLGPIQTFGMGYVSSEVLVPRDDV